MRLNGHEPIKRNVFVAKDSNDGTVLYNSRRQGRGPIRLQENLYGPWSVYNYSRIKFLWLKRCLVIGS